MRVSSFSHLGATRQVIFLKNPLTVFFFSSLFFSPVSKDIPLHATIAHVGVEVHLHFFSSWSWVVNITPPVTLPSK